MGGGHSAPQRMCVGCRVRAARADLLRVVAVEGALLPDLGKRLPGRGAWLHHDPGCLEQAIRRRAFSRALRLGAMPDTSGLLRFYEAASK